MNRRSPLRTHRRHLFIRRTCQGDSTSKPARKLVHRQVSKKRSIIRLPLQYKVSSRPLCNGVARSGRTLHKLLLAYKRVVVCGRKPHALHTRLRSSSVSVGIMVSSKRSGRVSNVTTICESASRRRTHARLAQHEHLRRQQERRNRALGHESAHTSPVPRCWSAARAPVAPLEGGLQQAHAPVVTGLEIRELPLALALE